MDDLIDSTIRLLIPYSASIPSLEKKSFQKPTFEFLVSIVQALGKATGFANDIFTDDQFQYNNKFDFLRTLIDYTQICLGEVVNANPESICSNTDVEKTLLFMQSLVRAAEHPKTSFDIAAAKFKEKQSTSQKEVYIINPKDYKLLSYIGEGTSARVKLVTKIGETTKYALKELIDDTPESLRHFLSEGEILFQLNHPNIIHIYGISYGGDSKPPCLLLSYAPYSLDVLIAKGELNESEKSRIMTEVVEGMRYLHDQKYMHRDLKPANVLLDEEMHVLIADFGLATKEKDKEQLPDGGTLRYMAPELFEDSDVIIYDSSVDVYSFGVMLSYLITEKNLPFSFPNITNKILPPLSDDLIDWVRQLILRCISFTPSERPSFSEIATIFQSHNNNLFAP